MVNSEPQKETKIAILSLYSPLVQRGVETFAWEISRRLSPKFRISIFQAAGGKNNHQTGSISPVRIVSINTPVSPPQSRQNLLSKIYLDWQAIKMAIFTIKALPKLITGQYDIVIPLGGGWQTAITRVITKLTGAKLLISGHAGIGSDDATNLLLHPDVFVALTPSEENWAKRLAPEVKTALIPNGVDLSRFNPKVRPADIDLAKPIVVCASALDQYKRVDLTIRAVSKTKTLSLLVLGDGKMRGQIDSLAKRLLGKRYLRITVPYEDIPAYYRAGQVFTLGSKTEAFGIAYLEAMACNLPVVTTSDRSRQEIIGDAGILTNPQDLNQYAKDLLLAARGNYRNLPYNQALNFSWNKTAKKYADLITNLVNDTA